jgi:hypothetical protein
MRMPGPDIHGGKSGVPSYRLYCIDGADRITHAEWIEADSDELALEAARTLKLALRCEVWQRKRLVGCVNAYGD